MANYIENPNIVSDGIYMTMVAISRHMPFAYFGGSISLVAHGLIARKVSDIDVVIPMAMSIPQVLIDGSVIGEASSDTVRDVDGNEIRRTGLNINGIKICVFRVDPSKIYGNVVSARRDGDIVNHFNIQDVNTTIFYKNLFASSNPKHRRDIESVQQRLRLLMSDDVLVLKAREYYDEHMVGEPLYSDTILQDMVGFVKYLTTEENSCNAENTLFTDVATYYNEH